MSKTIRKISEELKITKQAVSQRMDTIDNFRENHTKMIGNRIIVDESGEKLIVNFEIDKNKRQDYQQEQQQERKDDDFELLKHQLNVKDAQIEKLLDELTQQQSLYQDLLNENKVLRGRIDQSSRESERHRHWRLWR